MISTRIDEIHIEGSGHTIVKIDGVRCLFAQYNPIAGSCWVDTPNIIKVKKATKDTYNKDDRCFLYAVSNALQPKLNDYRDPTAHKKMLKSFIKFGTHYSKISFSVKLMSLLAMMVLV